MRALIRAHGVGKLRPDPRNLEPLLGQTLRLKVLEVNRGKQTVVLSHRIILETERTARRQETLARRRD